jgi:transposase InsO family protein
LHGPIHTCHFLALVDDHSRYLLGIHVLPTKEAVPVLETLAEAIELCGIPLALMSDNGTPFVTIVRTMLSRFQRSLAELEIRHIRTQVDTPWTNGKDVHLCQAASSARSGMNSVPALSIAQRTRSFVRARAMIA